jgi:hypothetical protein
MKSIKNLYLIIITCIFFACAKDEIKPIIIIPNSVADILTLKVDSINLYGARVTSKVNFNGGCKILKRGICYSIDSIPNLEDFTIENNDTSQFFISKIKGLEPGKTYYVRSFAENCVGIRYSNSITFNTNTEIPTILNNRIINITYTNALCEGEVLKSNGDSVLHRGIFISKINPINNPNFNPFNLKAINCGVGTGKFSFLLTQLDTGTQYYIKSFATNSKGTSYSNWVSFKTKIAKPIVKTINISFIENLSATLSGSIISTGGAEVSIKKGFCYSNQHNPTTQDNKIENLEIISKNFNEYFSSTIKGLLTNKKYYVRAYAENSSGIAYGNEVEFISNIDIGYYYQGGLVAYKFKKGDSRYIEGEIHGMIMLDTVFTDTSIWSNGTYINTGAIESKVGFGLSNTNLIVSAQGNGIYAAKLCYDFSNIGYTDWFLPTIDELTNMYYNWRKLKGEEFWYDKGFWSSTEIDDKRCYAMRINWNGLNLQMSASGMNKDENNIVYKNRVVICRYF